jgi:hypothetical protein
MALGYFFLSAFCLFACGHSSQPLQLPLLWAGWAAVLVGAVFFVSACAPLIREITNWFRVTKEAFAELARLVPLARELPPHLSTFQEGRPAEVVAE